MKTVKLIFFSVDFILNLIFGNFCVSLKVDLKISSVYKFFNSYLNFFIQKSVGIFM